MTSIPAAAACFGWESFRCLSAYRRTLLASACADQTVRIVLQQVAAAHHSFGGGADLRHVFFVSPVAFFERRPRITGGEPLGFGLGEGYERTGIGANVTFVEAAANDIPARISSQGSLVKHAGHAGDFVAVRVHFGNHHGKYLPDGGRLHRNHAGQIVVVELGSKIILVERSS